MGAPPRCVDVALDQEHAIVLCEVVGACNLAHHDSAHREELGQAESFDRLIKVGAQPVQVEEGGRIHMRYECRPVPAAKNIITVAQAWANKRVFADRLIISPSLGCFILQLAEEEYRLDR